MTDINKDLKEKNEQFDEIMVQLLGIFAQKNRAYGNDYFSGNYTEQERWMSVKRKIARLEAHYKLGKDSALPSETILDTWQDLAIYCIMELIILKK